MNLFAILSLKLEYILIYKKTFENWTKFNFEINEREYSKLSLNYYGDLKFVEGYQWNHTNWKKNLIRAILSIVFCIICLSPMSIIFKSDNQVLILVVGIALPSILITIGTFFFNKLIFKSFGLTKIAEYKMINNNEN